MRPIALLACLLSTAVLADDAGLKRCREIADGTRRLACYDAMPIAGFGLEYRPQPDELASIETHIAGDFTGWGPGSRFRLANGQVWEVVDGSSGYAPMRNPKVSVRRGSFGAFYLDLEGLNASPRVRRVQ